MQACRRGDVLPQETGSSGGTLQALPLCLFVSRALAYCLLLLEFLAFVPQRFLGLRTSFIFVDVALITRKRAAGSWHMKG